MSRHPSPHKDHDFHRSLFPGLHRSRAVAPPSVHEARHGPARPRHAERAGGQPRRAQHPARARSRRRGPHRVGRHQPDRAGLGDRPRAGARRGRSRLGAALVRADAVDPRRIPAAHRVLRAPAAAAGLVPRSLAVGAAAEPHDAGHQPHPPLARVRHRAAGRQRHHDRHRLGDPVPLALGARHHLPRVLAAAVVRGLPLREAVRRARAPEPGPGGRPRDRRGRERPRHPRPQGVRAGQARPAASSPRRPRPCARPSSARRARSAPSGSGWCCCPTSRSPSAWRRASC